MKEEELVYKAQQGDNEAFGALYDSYFPKIYRFIFLKVRRKHDAEDLSHQTFLSAWKNIGGFSYKGYPFSSWLYKIAHNAVIDFYRTAREHLDIEEVGEEKFGFTEDLEHGLETALAIETARKLIQELTDDEQNVIIMKFVDELGNKEIAEALQKTEGAIRVIQHRALKQLRQKMEKNG